MSRLDRDAARRAIKTARYTDGWIERLIDALERCVIPDPAQTIDRNALTTLLLKTRHGGSPGLLTDELAEAILALLRPVDSVTLTRKEAVFAALIMRAYDEKVGSGTARALADRLEAKS